jgi:hypothetical protein
MRPSVKIFHWLPRVICIVAILFISLFAADAYDPKLAFFQQVLAFIMHLIPSFILVIFLVVAWKWELAGGILFGIIGLGTGPWVFMHNYQMNHSVAMSTGIVSLICLPFVVVGGLFILSHFLKRKIRGLI